MEQGKRTTKRTSLKQVYLRPDVAERLRLYVLDRKRDEPGYSVTDLVTSAVQAELDRLSTAA